MKDIFKEEMPGKIYVKDGEILEKALEKICCRKQPETAYLNTLDYDKEPPRNPDGAELKYDNKDRGPDSKHYKAQRERWKKTADDP